MQINDFETFRLLLRNVSKIHETLSDTMAFPLRFQLRIYENVKAPEDSGGRPFSPEQGHMRKEDHMVTI